MGGEGGGWWGGGFQAPMTRVTSNTKINELENFVIIIRLIISFQRVVNEKGATNKEQCHIESTE